MTLHAKHKWWEAWNPATNDSLKPWHITSERGEAGKGYLYISRVDMRVLFELFGAILADYDKNGNHDK